jgi:hypothetical protein
MSNFEFVPENEGQVYQRQLAAVDDPVVMAAAESMFSAPATNDAERKKREEYFLDTLVLGNYINLQNPDIAVIRGIKKMCRRRLWEEGRS